MRALSVAHSEAGTGRPAAWSARMKRAAAARSKARAAGAKAGGGGAPGARQARGQSESSPEAESQRPRRGAGRGSGLNIRRAPRPASCTGRPAVARAGTSRRSRRLLRRRQMLARPGSPRHAAARGSWCAAARTPGPDLLIGAAGASAGRAGAPARAGGHAPSLPLLPPPLSPPLSPRAPSPAARSSDCGLLGAAASPPAGPAAPPWPLLPSALPLSSLKLRPS